MCAFAPSAPARSSPNSGTALSGTVLERRGIFYPDRCAHTVSGDVDPFPPLSLEEALERARISAARGPTVFQRCFSNVSSANICTRATALGSRRHSSLKPYVSSRRQAPISSSACKPQDLRTRRKGGVLQVHSGGPEARVGDLWQSVALAVVLRPVLCSASGWFPWCPACYPHWQAQNG